MVGRAIPSITQLEVSNR